MAIAHDAASRFGDPGSVNSDDFNVDSSWTHTPVGIPAGVVVTITQPLGSPDQVSGVTYGDVPMSRVVSAARTVTEQMRVYIYFLGQGIPTGPQTVAVTLNTQTGAMKQAHCFTLTAATPSTAADASNSGDLGIVANPSITVTHSGSLTGWAGYAAHCWGGGNVQVTGLQAGETYRYGHDPGVAVGMVYTRHGGGAASSSTYGYTTLASDDQLLAAIVVKELADVSVAAGNPTVAGSAPDAQVKASVSAGQPSAVGTAPNAIAGVSSTGQIPTVRGSGTLTTVTTAGTSYVINRPSGVLAGELLLASITLNAHASFVAGEEFGVGDSGVPAGWTKLYNDSQATNASMSLHVFKRVAGGTPGSATTDPATYTFTVAQAVTGSGSIVGFEHIDGTVLDGDTNGQNATDTVTLSLVNSIHHGLLVSFAGMDSGSTVTYTGPSGWTPQWGYTGTVGQRNACATLEDTYGGQHTVTWVASIALQQGAWAAGLTPDSVIWPGNVVHLWTGATTSDGATVVARLGGAVIGRLKVATDQALTTGVVFGEQAFPDVNGLTRMTITGLAAATQYYYGVEVDGVLDTDVWGSFKTAPASAASFAVAFGSCHDEFDGTVDAGSWTRALARNPDLLVINGDFTYHDIAANDPNAFRNKFNSQFGLANLHEACRKLPVVYTWSDHDFGGNNSNTNSASKPAAQSVYRQYVPHYPLEVSDGIYHAFTYGRVRFIVADERSYKSDQAATDNSSKTVLGTAQKTWFKDQITNATEPLILWVGDAPWIAATSPGADTWAGYTTERTELANHIAASGKRVVRLMGDMHAVAADSGVNSPGGFPVLHGAPWRNAVSNKGGPYTQGPYPTSGGQVEQYGYLEITDTGTALSWRFRGFDGSDVAQVGLTSAGPEAPTVAPTALSPGVSVTVNAGSATAAGTAQNATTTSSGPPGTPDAILAATNLAGVVSTLWDDPTSPDTGFLTATTPAIGTDLRVSFPTPITAPGPGGPTIFQVWARRTVAFSPSTTVENFNASIGTWHVSTGGGTLSYNTTSPIEGAGQMRYVRTWPASGAADTRLDNGPISATDRTANGLAFQIMARLAAGDPTGVQARLEVYADGADHAGPFVNLVPGQVVEVAARFASTVVDSMEHWTLAIQRAASTAVTTTIDFDLLQQGSMAADPTCTLELWEAGVFVRELTSVAVTSINGQLVTGTLDPAELADETGADVELRVVGVPG